MSSRSGLAGDGRSLCRLCNRGQWLLGLPFISATLDSLLSYFARNLGFEFRTGYFVLFTMIFVATIFGSGAFRLRARWVISLTCLCIAMLTGAAFVDNLGVQRAIKTLGVPIYFMAGYVLFRWIISAELIQRIFLFVGIAYVGVCIAALTRFWPQLFPVVDMLVLKGDVFIPRPEVMTDQNFQVLYLIPVAMGLIMARSITYSVLFGALSVLSAYVLAQMGTRSGILTFLGLIGIGLIACIRNPELGRKKLVVVPAALALFATAFIQIVIEKASLLLFRFQDTGAAGAYGRAKGTLYLFDKISDPLWWIPRGTSDFQSLTGSLPHSTVTAFYLDAGMLGLIFWCVLILLPTCILAKKMIKGQLDASAAAVACGGIVVVVLQFSLYAITASQIWVWAGCVVGVLERLQHNNVSSFCAGLPTTRCIYQANKALR